MLFFAENEMVNFVLSFCMLFVTLRSNSVHQYLHQLYEELLFNHNSLCTKKLASEVFTTFSMPNLGCLWPEALVSMCSTLSVLHYSPTQLISPSFAAIWCCLRDNPLPPQFFERFIMADFHPDSGVYTDTCREYLFLAWL